MMSSRLCLYYAGFACRMPSLYYELNAFADQLSSRDHKTLKECGDRLALTLEDAEHESISQIRTASNIATHMKVPLLPEPGDLDSYTRWRDHFIEKVEDRHPMNQINYYYFYYARRMAELYCNIGAARQYLLLEPSLKDHVEVKHLVGKNLADAEYILFKLIAAAALLSSEHGHRHFNVFYQDINKRFGLFRQVDHEHLKNGEREALALNLEHYGILVKKGIEECFCTINRLS
jgi:hypothetical protein